MRRFGAVMALLWVAALWGYVCATVADAEGLALREVWEREAEANGDPVSDRRYAEHVVRVVWGSAGAPVDQALRVIHCETGGTYRHDAIGRAGEVGYFQVHPIHGYPKAVLLDPWENSRIALGLWQRQGWVPWSCKP